MGRQRENVVGLEQWPEQAGTGREGHTMTQHFDLGTYTRPVTAASATAQAAFDRGLVWLYGYNHEAAAEAFEDAIAEDPGCGAAMWGLAYAVGPNYNKPWEFFTEDERRETLEKAHETLARAKALRETLSPVENDLIDALADRYPTDPTIEDYAPWNDAFSDAMREVYGRHGTDLDVITIFAEALMNRTPWLCGTCRAGSRRKVPRPVRRRRCWRRRSRAWPARGIIPAFCTCTST
jgi:hypothetical protein